MTMNNVDLVAGVYAAFGKGDVPKVLGAMHPQIQWTETAGYKYGGVYRSPQAVLENVFGPTQCRTIRYCADCRQPFEAIKPV